MNAKQVFALIFAIGLLLNAISWSVYSAEPGTGYWNQNAGWNAETGFDCAGVDTSKFLEPHWSKWMASQAGLDPEKSCEVHTFLGLRCDIATSREAIEVEHAKKWKESIPQAREYASQLHLQPAVILLSRGTPEDRLAISRCLAECRTAFVRLYVQRIPENVPVPILEAE